MLVAGLGEPGRSGLGCPLPANRSAAAHVGSGGVDVFYRGNDRRTTISRTLSRRNGVLCLRPACLGRLFSTSDVLRHLLFCISGSLRRSPSGVQPPDAEMQPRAGELPGDALVQLRSYGQDARCQPLGDPWRLVGGWPH